MKCGRRKICPGCCRRATPSPTLPARDAFAHAAALTAHTLRQPEVWAAVERLADALARAGTLTHGLRGLLPAALPGWPASDAPA